MNSIRVHPFVTGLVLAGAVLLGVARSQRAVQIPVLTADQAEILSMGSV